MGEYFVSKGSDVLVIFDDLTKHAWAYRQLSLLMDRPPGREAYPGDIFYVQTQLMERAGKFNDEHGGGSMTFLGIAETLQGDLTGYIPSNLASMCDGQICMSSQSFAEGQRPAVDLGLSLSIIGGRVQPPILKTLSSSLRADYARYSEVSKLSRLQTGLSGEAAEVVNKGEAIIAVLQQAEHKPVSMLENVLLLYALHKGLISGLPREQVDRFAGEILAFARAKDQPLLDQINEKLKLTPEIERGLDEVVLEYFAMEFSGGQRAAAAKQPEGA
jgi:F-type H+-transporting ATPase subunit alpha